MMGRKTAVQNKLFYETINLDRRVRKDHVLRKIAQLIDFDFTYKEVQETYGHNGNVSVPPPVVLKMMLLLILYNVRSERELIDTIPERLDWLWFLGYDLDDDIPNHSVLSKARNRWGIAAFKSFFERIVWQCVKAGLVDGSKLFMDSSSKQSKKDIKTRQHLMERSFARAERYGFKRARWRRLWRVQIQEYLTATIQNIKVLVKENNKPHTSVEVKVALKRRIRSLRPVCNSLSAQLHKTLLTFKSNWYAEIGDFPCLPVSLALYEGKIR